MNTSHAIFFLIDFYLKMRYGRVGKYFEHSWKNQFGLVFDRFPFELHLTDLTDLENIWILCVIFFKYIFSKCLGNIQFGSLFDQFPLDLHYGGFHRDENI